MSAEQCATSVCACQAVWPNDDNTTSLPAEEQQAARCVSLWFVLGHIASDQSDENRHEAAQLVANSSGDVLHRARAIKEHGKTRVFEGIEDICTLFTEAFSSYLQELAKYGTPDQLDVGKTAVVPDAAGLCDNASDCMRSSAKSKALLSRVVTEKVQAIRSVPLLDCLRMRSFALDDLEIVRQWAKKWNKRLQDEGSET